jgi:HAD superfamily hydrolase (TIGR01509 family)
MRFADLDAVTIDAFGTLLTLADPTRRLSAALRRYGVERTDAEIRHAFEAEAAYYQAHARSAHDAASLASLRLRCSSVFVETLQAPIDPEDFCSAYVESLVFEPVPGAAETVEMLASRGLALAVVADWDPSLRDHLREHSLDDWFAAVVISGELGSAKPDPRPFQAALRALAVTPDRAIHVGDSEVDEQGARAAGMHFAPAPLAEAFSEWE